MVTPNYHVDLTERELWMQCAEAKANSIWPANREAVEQSGALLEGDDRPEPVTEHLLRLTAPE